MKSSLIDLRPRNILLRSTNWIGDAIMTTPAVRTIRRNFPEARIAILAKPWVADVFAASPHVDEVILYRSDGPHRGIHGLWQLAAELRARRFDMALLLQNAFEAALLARLARIPVRAGYRRDARSWLLTHPVTIRPQVRKIHQVHYYQDLLRQLGLTLGPDELHLELPRPLRRRAKELAASLGNRPLIGLNPGAAYGPAKCWPARKYGELACRLHEQLGATLLVFGTAGDAGVAAEIKGRLPGHVVDLAGKTKLDEAMALIEVCDAFVTNDSGLMHVAAALRTPLTAIFGSTDAVATGPHSLRAVVIQKDLPCRPCLKPECKEDFACMEGIGVEEVLAAVLRLLENGQKPEETP
ncbi:MAG: lipopolysaccharide heptosyltransferase II [Desulfobacteraceae bacterium]|nr:lipopolysaccharide heptosyltransferase II [Desulfobacteraceae bacterium]